MKLILTAEVTGLGLAGDIVEVADGYGRNYLVPRGDAIAWTKGGEKQIASIKRARDSRVIRDRSHAAEIKNHLEQLKVTLVASNKKAALTRLGIDRNFLSKSRLCNHTVGMINKLRRSEKLVT